MSSVVLVTTPLPGHHPPVQEDDARRERFELLARLVWQPVTRFLRRRAPADTVDDLLADVLLVLWRRLDDVPPDDVLPWCYGVVRGCLANERRGRQRRLRLLRRLAAEQSAQPPAEPPADDPELAEALGSLRPADREVLRLWAWEGLEARDIAVVLGCSAGAAASRLSRARAALGDRLRQDPVGAGQVETEGQEGIR